MPGCGSTGLAWDVLKAGCSASTENSGTAGSSVRLMDKGAIIGRVVRTRDGVKPVYVSIGHKIDLDTAVRIVLRSCRGYRLPEPTRQAHLYVNEMRCSH